MFKCTQCGHMQEEEASLCPQCGKELVQQDTPPVSEQEEDAASSSVTEAQEASLPSEGSSDHSGENESGVSEEQPETEGKEAEALLCANCGGQIPANGKFCAMCGVPVAQGAAGPELPVAPDVSQAPEIPTSPVESAGRTSQKEVTQSSSKTQAPPQQYVQHPYTPPQPGSYAPPPIPRQEGAKPAEPARKGRKTLGIAIAAAVVFLVAIGAFIIYQMDGQFNLDLPALGTSTITAPAARHDYSDIPIVYIQDGDTLKYKTSTMDRAETITGSFKVRSDYYDWLAERYLHYISKDGAYLLYLNDFRTSGSYSIEGKGELYVRDLGKASAAGETDIGVKVASDVTTEFYISGNNKYVFYITSKNDLYAWDFSEAYKIDSDVTGVYDWSDDMIFYYKGDVDDYYTSYFSTRDCYVAPLYNGGREKREKVDTDVNDMLDWNDAFTEFIYTKSTSSSRGSESVDFDVYHYYLDGNRRETLVSGVHEVLDADVLTDRIVYLVQQESDINFEDVIEDDMLAEDERITEPNMADFPFLEQYYDYNWYYDDDVDYDVLMEEFERYEEAEKAYNAKKRRDSIREMFNDELDWDNTLDISLYEIYYIDGGEKVRVDGNVYVSLSHYDTEVYAYLEEGYAAYMKADIRTLPKLKFSEMEGSYYAYSFDLEEYIQENLIGELYVTMLDGGAPSRLSSAADNIRPKTYSVVLDANKDGFYYQAADLSDDQEEEEEEEDYYSSYYSGYYSNYSKPVGLYYAPIEGDSVGTVTLIDGNIEFFNYSNLYQGKNLYITKGKDDIGDLYMLDGNERERIAYDISNWDSPWSYNGGETLFFYEDYDTNRNMGSLYMMKNGEKERIYDGVYEYYYRADDLIYLHCNHRSGKGDLYLYNGETVVLVDYDVTDIMDPWYHYYQDAAQ